MKMAKSVAVVMTTMAGAAMLVSGCGSTGTTNSTGNSAGGNSTGASQPTKGGTIDYALPAQTNLNWFIPEFNAANDSLYNDQLIVQMYKPLLWINNDYTINWNSSIANKITYNKQGTVYHVFLNKKWKWSDGTPVTSKDLMFSWNVVKAASASNAPKPWPFVGVGTGDIPNGVQSVVANNNYEVTFTLKKPANQQWFEYNGLMQLTPMPAHAWNKYTSMTQELKYLGNNAGNLMFDKVVDGPFEPVSATSSQSWVLKPNPSYAGHKSTVNKLVFQFESSTTAEFSALKSGAINIGYLDASQLGSKSALTSQGDTMTPQYQFGIFWTEMNMWPTSPTKSIFNQLYVRQALQMSMDNVGISKNIYKGYAVPLDGPIPTTPKTQFISSQLQTNPYPYNLQKAKKLLTSNGWVEKNGVMTKGNQKMNFTLMYVTGSTASTDATELLKEDWAKIGVQVTLKGEPFSTFISITSNPKDHSWDLATGSGWIYNGPGFYPSGGQLFASTAPSGTGFSNPTEDQLIAATHLPYATAQLTMQHFFAYENYTAKILPFLWGQNVGILSIVAPNVHNYQKYAEPSAGLPQLQYVTVS